MKTPYTDIMLATGRKLETDARRAGLFDLADNQRQWSDAFEAYLIPEDNSIPDWYPAEFPSALGKTLLCDMLTDLKWRERL